MSLPRSFLERVIALSLLALVTACNNDASSPNAGGSTDPTVQVGGSANVSTSNGGTSSGAGRWETGISQPGTSPSGGESPRNTGGTKGSGIAAGGTSATHPGGTEPVAYGGTSAKGLTLYYIRHAQVVANTVDPSEVTYENSETLTALGLQQVEALKTYLMKMDVTPDAVFVSPHKRTQKTIEPYLTAKNVQGEVWMELAECCADAPTGAALPTAPTYMQYLKAAIEGKNLAFRDATATQFWQNDTYEAGLFMVMTARNSLLSRYGQSGKTVFVVGHASAGQVMIGLLQGNDMLKGRITTGPNAVYLLNTGIMRLIQDPTTGLFKVDGKNINNPVQE